MLIDELIARGRLRACAVRSRAHLRVDARDLRDLLRPVAGTGKLVDVGEAVGIIAASPSASRAPSSTMRTFHTGGVAGEDITHGLPRVQELFEARVPKGVAPISEVAGPGAYRGGDGLGSVAS